MKYLCVKYIEFAMIVCHIGSYLYPYTIFDRRRADIIDLVEGGVHDRLHVYPCAGSFTFPGIGIDHMEGTRRLLLSHPKDTFSNVESQVFTPNITCLVRAGD